MILDLKTRARRARGGRCRALPVEDEARHKEGQKHSENKRVVRAKFELMFQPARLARNPTVSAINKTVLLSAVFYLYFNLPKPAISTHS